MPVRFSGIAPDLFVEGSGVVAEGRLGADGTFVADNLLAKHDENYVPRELQGMEQHQAAKMAEETTVGSRMIAELGLAALWLAAALAALQMIAGFMAVRQGASSELASLIRPAAVVQGVLVTFSFAMLVWLFAITDLSVKLVASNSHSMKPLIFKLSGSFGNHEGSMLLWGDGDGPCRRTDRRGRKAPAGKYDECDAGSAGRSFAWFLRPSCC